MTHPQGRTQLKNRPLLRRMSWRRSCRSGSRRFRQPIMSMRRNSVKTSKRCHGLSVSYRAQALSMWLMLALSHLAEHYSY